ncbi:Serine/threonine protein kinase [Streptomyces melanosporofaciens]|uniref:non-specific serine/threonine protein kinase n=1 Tax=Streptomyces melanosporofaciens TaxID=67327 RepID=A0A1H4RIA7_STRMJ|nr:Serine/threonine protein kinase [Streptomyces melanosporofaciens]
MEDLGAEDPRWIGEYRLLRRLGAGGMGRVFLAHSSRGRTVAVKLVQTELAQQAEFRRRFKQEVRAAQRVGGAWTAPVLDADTEAATPWVATGYIAGPSLHAIVSESGRLPERTVRILAHGLTQALRDIHDAGLVHRDLKPSNVLVTIDGPRVIDFGIARALETVTDGILTRSGAVVGSPGFMSPEQVRGERVTPASDVFCLGSVLAYAATGRQPFGTANSGVHAVMYRIAQEEADLEGLPEGLRELVTDCLKKAPDDRPSLEELLDRTAGADDDGEPWLPGGLVAQLGRHAVQLLEVETPAGPGVPALPGMPARPAVPPVAGAAGPATPVAGAAGPAVPPPPSAPPSATSYPLAPAEPPTPPPPTTPPPTTPPLPSAAPQAGAPQAGAPLPPAPSAPPSAGAGQGGTAQPGGQAAGPYGATPQAGGDRGSSDPAAGQQAASSSADAPSDDGAQAGSGHGGPGQAAAHQDTPGPTAGAAGGSAASPSTPGGAAPGHDAPHAAASGAPGQRPAAPQAGAPQPDPRQADASPAGASQGSATAGTPGGPQEGAPSSAGAQAGEGQCAPGHSTPPHAGTGDAAAASPNSPGGAGPQSAAPYTAPQGSGAQGTPGNPAPPPVGAAPAAPDSPGSASHYAAPAYGYPPHATPPQPGADGEPRTPPHAFGPPAVTSFGPAPSPGQAAATPSVGFGPSGPNGPNTPAAPGGPGGPGRQGGPGGGSPQPPQPKRRRKTLIVVSAAVATLLIAGIAALAVVKGNDDKGDKAKTDYDKMTHTPPNSPGGANSKAPTGGSGAPDPSATKLDTTGDVPTEYLGAWEGEIKESGSSTGKIRRIVLSQGPVGAFVAETLTSDSDSFCQDSAKLKSADSLLLIEDDEVTTSIPEESCSTVGEQTLRIGNDGTLAWSTTDGSYEATLRPSKSGGKPIPSSYEGTWLAKDAFGKQDATLKITIKQGAIGTAVAQEVADSKKYHCEGDRVLASVAKGLVLSPSKFTGGTPKNLCGPGTSLTFTSSGHDKLRVEYDDPDDYSDETMTQTFTRLD